MPRGPARGKIGDRASFLPGVSAGRRGVVQTQAHAPPAAPDRQVEPPGEVEPPPVRAKQRGAYRGRKKALGPERVVELRRRAAAGEQKAKLAREFGISRETLYRYLRTED